MLLSGLVFAFIVLPLTELAILLEVRDAVGLFPTLAVVVLTGVIGAALAKSQGLRVLNEIQRELAMGRMPAPQIMDGVMILISGILLITPGLLTDTAGFLLLIPAVRSAVRAGLRRKLEKKLRDGSFQIHLH